jgi:hypothetical protein
MLERDDLETAHPWLAMNLAALHCAEATAALVEFIAKMKVPSRGIEYGPGDYWTPRERQRFFKKRGPHLERPVR